MKNNVSAYVVGFVFAIGLGVSGMTQSDKVIAFLDLAGNWNPSLALVMLGAIGTHFAFYRWIVKRPAPLFAGSFQIPANRKLDPRLVVGSAIFGIGWGVGGFCPGPALTSLASGNLKVFIFVIAMLAGMQLARLFPSKS